MEGRVKTGGRQAGTPNKASLDVQARLAALGCDPIEGMALLAMDAGNTPELRGKMFSELAQYVAPKRKAVEVTVREDDSQRSADDILSEIDAIRRRAAAGAGNGTMAPPVPGAPPGMVH